LARFRSINGVTGGDDTPLTESELREIFIAPPPSPPQKKTPTTQLPPILQNPQHKTSQQFPHYYYYYYFFFFFFTVRAPKHTYQKPKKIQNQILNSCYKL
jgi:hypothetical protein